MIGVTDTLLSKEGIFKICFKKRGDCIFVCLFRHLNV